MRAVLARRYLGPGLYIGAMEVDAVLVDEQ